MKRPRLDPEAHYARLVAALPARCGCGAELSATPLTLYCVRCGGRYLPDKKGKLVLL